MQKISANMAPGGVVDLASNRLTAVAFSNVEKLVRERDLTVVIAGNNDLASVSSQPHFASLFAAALLEVDQLLRSKDTNTPMGNVLALQKVGWPLIIGRHCLMIRIIQPVVRHGHAKSCSRV